MPARRRPGRRTRLVRALMDVDERDQRLVRRGDWLAESGPDPAIRPGQQPHSAPGRQQRRPSVPGGLDSLSSARSRDLPPQAPSFCLWARGRTSWTCLPPQLAHRIVQLGPGLVRPRGHPGHGRSCAGAEVGGGLEAHLVATSVCHVLDVGEYLCALRSAVRDGCASPPLSNQIVVDTVAVDS